MSPSARRRRISTTRWLTTGAVVVAAVTAAFAVHSSSGTLALWNDEAAVPEATIEVGGMDLRIAVNAPSAPAGQTTAAIPSQTWATMLPGDIVGVPVLVANPGSSQIRISAALNAQAANQSDVAFWLSRGACPATGTAGIKLTATPAAPSGQTVVGNVPHCLQVALSDTVPAARQGTPIIPSFTLTITGTLERTP